MIPVGSTFPCICPNRCKTATGRYCTFNSKKTLTTHMFSCTDPDDIIICLRTEVEECDAKFKVCFLLFYFL